MQFIPEQPKQSARVPYYESARGTDGWVGQRTEKPLKQLRSELMQAITRLGGTVTKTQEGVFQDGPLRRAGLRIFYYMEVGEVLHEGRIDAAALPVRVNSHWESSKKMMLYMLRDAFNGLWLLQQLAPGYAALMPFLLVDGEHNITQLWSDRGQLSLLLPSPDTTFVEGEYTVE